MAAMGAEPGQLEASFRAVGAQLDDRNDRRERLTKLSRDVTIGSKRTIFLLHRVCGAADRGRALAEAEARLADVRTLLAAVASELQPPASSHLYRRHVSPGLQEYVEAATFLFYLQTGGLASTQQLEGELGGLGLGVEDYLLGVGDLGGELMRLAINSAGLGDTATPHRVLAFLRTLAAAYSALPHGAVRELPKKAQVLADSLAKVENACYTLSVRGSELPRHLLADALQGPSARLDHDSP